MKRLHVPVSHPWVCIDLDGTLMEDGHYPDFGPPIPGAVSACKRLHERGVKIMVFTARTSVLDLDGMYQNVNKTVSRIYKWAKTNNVHIDYVFPMPKPTFVLAFFDDRAIHVNHNGADGWGLALAEFSKRYPDISAWEKGVLPPALPSEVNTHED